jgi:hypothetical protein
MKDDRVPLLSVMVNVGLLNRYILVNLPISKSTDMYIQTDFVCINNSSRLIGVVVSIVDMALPTRSSL